MTAHLIENLPPEDITSFFFCRFDDQASLKSKTIIGSVTRQLVNDLPAHAFRNLDYEDTSTTTMTKLLEAALNRTHQYYIVLDGLDECEEAQTKEVAEFFYGLLNSPFLRMKIFWSSRPNVPNWLPEKLMTQQHIDIGSIEHQSKVADDIHVLIRTTLEELLEGETPELQINDSTLSLMILNRLQSEAQGMYAALVS